MILYIDDIMKKWRFSGKYILIGMYQALWNFLLGNEKCLKNVKNWSIFMLLYSYYSKVLA